MKINSTNELLMQLSDELSAEELMLASLQGLIASEITIKRHEAGLSQKDFAKRMGVSQGLVSKWEAGENNYTLSTLVKIALALNIDMQVPYVLDKPKIYTSKDSIIYLPGTNGWDTEYYENGSYHSVEELEEM